MYMCIKELIDRALFPYDTEHGIKHRQFLSFTILN
jgi:hypothetical protein